jgi:CTP:molybdopterin cytidylyltransferase MocA
MSSVAAVVLAAGESTRFGSPKQRLLLPAVLARLQQTDVGEIVVAEGAHELELPRDSSHGVPVRIVPCSKWHRGPGASLRCGLAALDDRIKVAVVVLADGPKLAPAAVTRVLDVWRVEGGIVAASYEGARGHPLVIGRGLWDDIPDEGLATRPVRLVPCDDLGPPGDVDTPADLPAELDGGKPPG